MRRAILLALILVGCRQQATPLANPFLAPDRVPPPATRTPAPGTAVPYYGGGSVPPVVPPSGAAVSGANGRQFGQLETGVPPIDADALAAGLDAQSPDLARGEVRLAANSDEPRIGIPTDDFRERIVHTTAPKVVAPIGRATRTRPQRPYPEIAELPIAAADRAASAPRRDDKSAHNRRSGDEFRPRGGGAPPSDRGEVQTVAYNAPVPFPTPQNTRKLDQSEGSTRPGRSRYGHEADYAWLMGKLEHSRAAKQWKLRYIPIDGATDEYGGSVLLENPEALGDLAAGDFVRIRGTRLGRDKDAVSFAPLYRIMDARPLAD